MYSIYPFIPSWKPNVLHDTAASLSSNLLKHCYGVLKMQKVNKRCQHVCYIFLTSNIKFILITIVHHRLRNINTIYYLWPLVYCDNLTTWNRVMLYLKSHSFVIDQHTLCNNVQCLSRVPLLNPSCLHATRALSQCSYITVMVS